MDLSYVDGKVREALTVARGSRATAQKMIIQAALRDDRLLQGLAAPFLKAIVGAAIERVLRRSGDAGSGAVVASAGSRANPARQSLSPEALDAVLRQMGQNPPAAAAAAAAVAAVVPVVAAPVASSSQAARILGGGEARPAAGARHEAAMRTIAAAFSRRPKNG